MYDLISMKKILTTPKQYKGRSGLTGRILVYLGLFFIFIFVFFKLVSIVVSSESTGFLKSLYDISISSTPESFVALGIIIVFFGLVFLFFSHQFSKLADIADEIENSEEFSDEKID